MKSSYSKITAAMEKLLYFWVDISDKRATNSTGIRANWINCLLYILKVLLNLHNFPLLNINCTEPYLGPLYRSDIIVQIFNCKIPERSLLNGAIYKRFQRFHAGEDVRPLTSCKFLFWRKWQIWEEYNMKGLNKIQMRWQKRLPWQLLIFRKRQIFAKNGEFDKG